MEAKMNKKYGFGFMNGDYEKQEGENVMEAYKKTGKKLPNGEINFSILDFIALLPIPYQEGEPEKRYQLFVIEKEGKESKKEGHPTNNLKILQKLLERKVCYERKFSAFIIDLYTDKVIDWKCNA